MDGASPTSDLIASMRALADALDRHDAQTARANGLGRNDALALRYLCERGPAAPGTIQDWLGLTSGTVTALVDRLARAGMVKRQPHPDDRRALIVTATHIGKSAHADAHSRLDQIAGKLAARLPQERRAAITRQLCDLARMVDWASSEAAEKERAA